MSMEVKLRRAVEHVLVKKTIARLLDAGYWLDLDDGEEVVLEHSRDPREILDAMFSVDEETLIVRDAEGNIIGRVEFIYGNSGWDVVHDYSTSLEEVMREVLKAADLFESDPSSAFLAEYKDVLRAALEWIEQDRNADKVLIEKMKELAE